MRKNYFSPDDRPAKPFPTKLVLLLFFNTVLLFGIYCYFVMRKNVNWLFWLYYIALAAVGLAYIIYNRGFSRDKLTAADLPLSWSEEKKAEFIAERDERKRKSKWLLTILFPLCLTIFFDVMYLFFGEQFSSMFATVGKFFGIG